MRTFRTVLVVLCLVLATSAVATAAPSEAESGVEARSFTSWVASALDWMLASISHEIGGALEPNGVGTAEPDGTDQAEPLSGDDPPDEVGGALDPGG